MCTRWIICHFRIGPYEMRVMHELATSIDACNPSVGPNLDLIVMNNIKAKYRPQPEVSWHASAVVSRQ